MAPTSDRCCAPPPARRRAHLVVHLTLLMAGTALGCHAASSRPPAPPTIVVQPVDRSVRAGESATFGVRATGGGPLTYQWRLDGAPIAGATSANLMAPPAAPADDGARFDVLVRDAHGGTTASREAILTVTAAATPAAHYVDPAGGSDLGDGSAARPWRSLQQVIDTKVETSTWEALPFVEGMNLSPVNAGAPVKPGDTIWLRSGYHGALTIQGAYNAAPVTIAAQAGHAPTLSRVLVRSSQNWVLRGLSVSPSHATVYDGATIVTVEDHDWRGPAHDVVIDGLEVFSVPDELVWTTASDWDTRAANAVQASGDRVAVRNCLIRNVRYGISMTGRGSRVEHNTVDGFCGDGLRGLGDDEVFEHNLVLNARDVNADHRDGFQSWSTGPGGVGTGVVRNVTLRGNVIIGYRNPSVPFAGTLQGIGCFDGFYDGWTVENNVVITNHWHGISFYGARNLRLVNNTVLDLDAVEPGPPWILVTAHKDGRASSGGLIRNNLTTDLSVSGDRMVADHNLLLPPDLAGYFVDVAHQDVHLAAGSPAIDQGSTADAPATDADGLLRPQGSAVDVGAYEFQP